MGSWRPRHSYGITLWLFCLRCLSIEIPENVARGDKHCVTRPLNDFGRRTIPVVHLETVVIRDGWVGLGDEKYFDSRKSSARSGNVLRTVEKGLCGGFTREILDKLLQDLRMAKHGHLFPKPDKSRLLSLSSLLEESYSS